MRRSISSGIDIGTHGIRVVVLEHDNAGSLPRIIGRGFAPASGIRRGYITNMQQAISSIRAAVDDATKTTGVKIKRAYISCGGISMASEVSVGGSIISRADKEVTALDIGKAINESEDRLQLANKKVLHTFPLQFKLDGKEIHGRPEGMKGVKLETKVLFVTILKQHVEDIVTAVTEAGVEVVDINSGVLSEASILLSDREKAAGCALLNIGLETTTLAVFEDLMLVSLQVFPIGGMDITKDIALGLKISLEDAEGIKLGSVIGDYPKKRIDEIIDARLGDVFELVENHLKKIKRNGLLPAGITLTGGGSHINGIEHVAREYLKLPAHTGAEDKAVASQFKLRDYAWFPALAVALGNKGGFDESNGMKDTVKTLRKSVKSFLSQLLP